MNNIFHWKTVFDKIKNDEFRVHVKSKKYSPVE